MQKEARELIQSLAVGLFRVNGVIARGRLHLHTPAPTRKLFVPLNFRVNVPHDLAVYNLGNILPIEK